MQVSSPSTLKRWIEFFLSDLQHGNRSVHTLRGYRGDLEQFVQFNADLATAFTANNLRAFLATFNPLRPATRAHKQAALASFFAWAVRNGLLASNPMDLVERVKLADPQPRALKREQIEQILVVIPPPQLRDRLLFRLLYETGLRVSEALALHVEDLDLTPDNEHLKVLGKGGRRRLVLLDDPALVKLLRRYLAHTHYQHGPLFRAIKNGRGGSLRYQSVQERWKRYCKIAAVNCTLHQLRHSHATELVNGGVSLATVRKRLGHKNLQTTLRYAEQSDEVADAEIRAWRRDQNS
ncbi:MAG: tyrosine-type recombinase/integrase [Aggregatilineales bacterium]